MKRKHYFHIFGPDIIENEDGELVLIEMNHNCFFLTPYEYFEGVRNNVSREAHSSYFSKKGALSIIKHAQENNLKKVVVFCKKRHFATNVYDDLLEIKEILAKEDISFSAIGVDPLEEVLSGEIEFSQYKESQRLIKSMNDDDTLYISNTPIEGEFEDLWNTPYNKGQFDKFLRKEGAIRVPSATPHSFDEASEYPNCVIKPVNEGQGDGVTFYKSPETPLLLKNETMQGYEVPKKAEHLYTYASGSVTPVSGFDTNRATDIRSKLAVAPDGRCFPLFTYRKFSPHTLPPTLPNGHVQPEAFLTNISKGGFYGFCSEEEDKKFSEFGKKAASLYCQFLRESDTPKHILWTGGYDSTFYLFSQALKGVVKPIYLSSIDARESEIREIIAMIRLSRLFKKTFPDYAENMLDFDIVTSIEEDAEVEFKCTRIGYGTSFSKRMGVQNSRIAHFAKSHSHPLYMCVENEHTSRMRKLIIEYVSPTEEGFVIKQREDFDEMGKTLDIFENIIFPILHLTKEDMLRISHRLGFLDLMRETWTCWFPRKGSPCGECVMCHERILKPKQKVDKSRQPVVVSYFTRNGDYPEFAENLKKQLRAAGIDYEIPLLVPAHDRRTTINLRWKLLNEAMEKYNRPLVWLDIDSDVAKGDQFIRFYENCADNFDFVARDKIHMPHMFFRNDSELREFSGWSVPIDNRWSGTQQFYNNTAAGKEILKKCLSIHEYEKNQNCYDEQVITLALRKVRQKYTALGLRCAVTTLPPEFIVCRSWMKNELEHKELKKQKMDYDNPAAVVKYIKINTADEDRGLGIEEEYYHAPFVFDPEDDYEASYIEKKQGLAENEARRLSRENKK